MTFKDAIMQSNFNDVKKSLLEFYPDQFVNINKYENVYNQLKSTNSINIDIHWMIIVELIGSILNEHKKEWHIYSVMIDDPFKEHYNINYTSWKELLNYDLNIFQINKLGISNLLAHCLYEMTFYGFDENTIQEKLNKIKIQEKKEEEFNEESADNISDFIIEGFDEMDVLDKLLGED